MKKVVLILWLLVLGNIGMKAEFRHIVRVDKKVSELKDTIDKTEHQLGETSETKLRNVDDNPNNDVEIDMDQEITLHDGTITTLAKEAETLNIAPDEYKKQFAEREADCYADKVELIREEQAEEQSAERAEEHEERAERSLENDAWERIRKHQ